MTINSLLKKIKKETPQSSIQSGEGELLKFLARKIKAKIIV